VDAGPTTSRLDRHESAA